jgi:predicted RNA-binding protein with EMAP domain
MKGGNMSELIEIGLRINRAIQAVWKSGLSIEDLEEFEDYINHQETIMPLLNPSSFQKHGKLFNDAKERIELLKPILQMKQKKEDK